MIDEVRDQTGCSARRACAVLGVARSSYYHAAEPTETQVCDLELGGLIEEIFRAHCGRYGYRRIAAELAAHGERCAHARVRRLMRQRRLRAAQPRRFIPATSDGGAFDASPNLLAGRAAPGVPDEVWAGDITYLRAAGGWLYLAVVIDLCSRRVVGWALAEHMRATLVTGALRRALLERAPDPDTIFHSDRGSQYSSDAFRNMLRSAAMTQSMSARANPYDNALTESFIGTLKRELIGDGIFEDLDDADTALFEYIEGYYNTRRRHSALGYISPMEFESQLDSTPLR